MGSLVFLTQESTKQNLSRATRIQKIQGRQEEFRLNKILGNKKAIQSKSQSEDGLQIPPQIWVSLVMDKEYIEIFVGGI